MQQSCLTRLLVLGNIPIGILLLHCLERIRQNSYLFAQHVFSEGIHGLSVATEEWLEKYLKVE